MISGWSGQDFDLKRALPCKSPTAFHGPTVAPLEIVPFHGRSYVLGEDDQIAMARALPLQAYTKKG
jgi:hypothetical protein